MNHHRCTGCKQEKDVRHKAYGGVFCEDCLRELRGLNVGHRSFLGDIWYSIRALVNLVTAPFRPKLKPEKKAVAAKVAYNTMKAKALKIPMNPATMLPQKR